ncbi:leucine-rich repeat domain-containing protein [Microbacter margulisiae]|uniref:Leucine rich repeat-containing protein n=1 Tax=Microbacter margulisiae TaxID=1350067 RepID=A0A7W5H363_9PORP|nr:leucine-rich repeat domain-containing protein [Microbacter margulisiae]MBB3188166.1 hypothetical protein [Microbacter margulisiae]
MKKLGFLIGILAVVFVSCSKNNGADHSSAVVNVSTAGTLSALLGNKLTTTMLIVKGTIDARDFVTIRDSMPDLKILDLSGATIVDYQGSHGTVAAQNVNYPDNVIPAFAFYNPVSKDDNTNLINVTLPTAITTIGDSAFMNCSGLSSFSIPAGVTTLGSGAFSGCTGFTVITIPSAVDFIGAYAFYNCRNLASIYAYAATPVGLKMATSVFGGINTNTCILYVPSASLSLYQAAVGWSDFTNIIAIGGGMNS